MIYFEKTGSLMYDISTNEAPSLIQQLFTKAGNVHGYGTRSATGGNYYVKSSRLEIQKNSFSRGWVESRPFVSADGAAWSSLSIQRARDAPIHSPGPRCNLKGLLHDALINYSVRIGTPTWPPWPHVKTLRRRYSRTLSSHIDMLDPSHRHLANGK